MKIKTGYSLRNVLDMYIVIGTGEAAYTPNCIMSVNEAGAALWNALIEDNDEEKLTALLMETYDIDEETAEHDVKVFLQQLRDKDLLETC